MPLFHPRVLDKRQRTMGPIPQAHKEILDDWAKNLAAGTYDSETQNDGEFIQRILIDVLGYVGSSGSGPWTVAKNQPVGTGNVDVALGMFDVGKERHILAPFELKGARTKDLDALMAGRNKTPVQQAWEYAMDAKGAKWVLVSNYAHIRLYAVGYGRKEYENFDLSTLSDPLNYNKIMLLLSAGQLLNGHTQNLLNESEDVQAEISKQLYADYRATRFALISEIINQTSVLTATDAVRVGQKILDRTLFVAFAEDKGLLKKNTLKETFEAQNLYNPQPVWNNFKGLFAAIDKGNKRLNIPEYNGGLFANDSEIDYLELSDTICEKLSAFGAYDYDTDVSVNILGHVFEQSISDLEELKNYFDPSFVPDTNASSKRQTDAIFYTPPYITRTIVEQSVGKWLSDRKTEVGLNDLEPLTDEDYASIKNIIRGKNKGQVVFNDNVRRHIYSWEKYRDKLSGIRVIDPACGSGAFLNEVFDYLFREGNAINRTLEGLYGGQINLFRWDTHILANNIFGVDINRESVEITKLSLWLKTANRNEKLTYLDNSIKVGNSVVKDNAVAGDLAFDWDTAFGSEAGSTKFDVVVGNPPYIDSEMMTKFWPREREYISNHFEQTKGNWDIYIAFFELGLNLLSTEGYLSFITPDKWISKDFGFELRKRILPKIISIIAVGRGVFEDALVDSIITTAGNKTTNTLQVSSYNHGETTLIGNTTKTEINEDEGFDQLLSQHYQTLKKFESSTNLRLGSFASTENACATSDTYILKEILIDAHSEHDVDTETEYKVANTGTLDRYVFRWGVQPMRYIMGDYTYPKVGKLEFESHLGATYRRRARSPKIIIKGLTLLDGALDLQGHFVPGKSTLVICCDDQDMLKFLAAVVNSRFASFYIKQKYASSSYNGGVNFTTDMIDSIPIPVNIDREAIVSQVDQILHAQQNRLAITYDLHKLIRSSGGPLKLTKKLHNWFELSGPDFVSELKKIGLSLSVTDRAEWVDILEKKRAAIKIHLASSSQAEALINETIIGAFGLTELPTNSAVG